MIKKIFYMQVRPASEQARIDPLRANEPILPNRFVWQKLAEGVTPEELKHTLGLALVRGAATGKLAPAQPDPDR